MGPLDALSDGSGGGLLEFLRANAMNQQMPAGLATDQAQYANPLIQAMAQGGPVPGMAPAQPSPLDTAQWPYGPNGAPSQANAMAPVPQQPPAPVMAQQPPQAAPQPQGPGFGDRIINSAQSFANSGGPLQALVNGATSLVTGERTDPGGVADRQSKAAQNLTFQALVQKGVDPAAALAAINNPTLLTELIKQSYGPKTVQALGNGYIADRNGNVTRAYEPESKKTFNHYKDANGNDVAGVFDPDANGGKGEFRPVNPPAQNAPAPPTSIDDLQKSDPAMAAQVQAVLDGRVPYPTGSRLNAKQQQLKELVTQIDPTFDASTSKTRGKFNLEFGSTSPSTVGGQKILMGTALGHLSEVAESAAGLGNSDGAGSGLAFVGHGINSVKNMTTDNAAKANALDDKVAKFSGEVGKLYSGSQGGGVHEREETRHRMGSQLTSAELAAGLEASRDLILSKQKALEDQATTIFGPEKAAKYDFIGEDGRKALQKIEESIAKLRGSAATQSAGNQPPVAPAAPDRSAIEAEMKRRGLIK